MDGDGAAAAAPATDDGGAVDGAVDDGAVGGAAAGNRPGRRPRRRRTRRRRRRPGAAARPDRPAVRPQGQVHRSKWCPGSEPVTCFSGN